MVCLDSSVIIDLLRKRVNLAQLELKLGENETAKIPSPAIIEIIRGLYLNSNIPNVRENEKERINKLFSSFPILDLDKDSAVKSGEIEADLINRGETIDIEDVMIAAIAIHNKEKLITRNAKHFERIKELEVEGY
ncbi:PIN domain-containing protein [Candidatus Pacearchaeota archaeon]|nr:PIN domain-containing protein [Candidatus Pacearchaeota archaeon]